MDACGLGRITTPCPRSHDSDRSRNSGFSRVKYHRFYLFLIMVTRAINGNGYHIALYRYQKSGDGDTTSLGPIYWGEDDEPLAHKEFREAWLEALQWVQVGHPHRWARIDFFRIPDSDGDRIILKHFFKDVVYTLEDLGSYN